MLRLLAVLTIGVAIWAGFSGQAERWILFPFDPTRISPETAGEPRLREVEFASAENTLILWTRKPKPGKPVILYLHGNAGNLALRAPRFARFINRGFGVVAVGYPGSSGSTGTPTADGINKDVCAVYLAMPELVGNAPVILYGESLGTGIAVNLSASVCSDGGVKGGPTSAAMVLEAPFTSVLDVGRAKYPYFEALFDRLPEPYNTQKWIATRSIPLLVLHGTEDEVIPFQMGRAVYEASGAEDKRFFAVKGAGHTDVWQPDAQRALWQFLGRH